MTLLLSALTAVLLQATPTDELAAAAKKTTALESYSYKVDTHTGTGGKSRPVSVEAKYQKDQPVAFKAASLEAFRKGATIVYKEGEEWKRVESGKGNKGGGKKGLQPAALADIKLPHDELADLEKAFEKIEKAEQKENDCAVFSGALTPAAAKAFLATGAKGKKQAPDATGTAKVWVNADGAIARYELTIKTKAQVKGAETEVTVTRTVALSEIGSAKVEVPEGAKKILDAQS